jgi:hypothetical protein
MARSRRVCGLAEQNISGSMGARLDFCRTPIVMYNSRISHNLSHQMLDGDEPSAGYLNWPWARRHRHSTWSARLLMCGRSCADGGR